MQKALSFLLLGMLSTTGALQAQSALYEAVDVTEGGFLTLSSDEFPVSDSITSDGTDALAVDVATSGESITQILQISSSQSGFLTLKAYSTTYYVDIYFDLDRGNGNWNTVRELNTSTDWVENTVFLNAGESYRLRVNAYRYNENDTVQGGLDDFRFEPVEEGNLQEALDLVEDFSNTGEGGLWFAQPDTTSDGVDALAATSNGSELELAVTGPALLRFDAQRHNGELNVLIDGDSAFNVSGNSWNTYDLIIPDGSHTITWRATSYYSSQENQPLATLDQFVLEPMFSGEVAEALDTTEVIFEAINTDEWLVAGPSGSSDAEDALRRVAKESFDNNLRDPNSLQGMVNGPAKVRFLWNALNQEAYFSAGRPGTFEPQWVDLASTGSSTEWTDVTFTISPGVFHLQWGLRNHYQNNYTTMGIDQLVVRPIEEIPLAEALDGADLEWWTGPEQNQWWGQDEESFDFVDAAASALIPRYGESWIQTVVEGPGTLSFRWKGEENGSIVNNANHSFRLYLGSVDGDETTWRMNREMGSNSSSTGNWESATVSIPAGRHQVAWQVERFYTENYYNNRSMSSRLYYLDSVRYAATLPTRTLFVDAVPSGGWMRSAWFGWFTENGTPWYFSLENGWIYVASGSTDANLSLYDTHMGEWFYTNQQNYPNLYRYSDGEWYLMTAGGGPGERWFYNQSTKNWVSEPDM